MSSQTDDINSVDPENTVSSKYYDIDELQNLKINNSSSFSLFHINACSLSRNFDDLQHLLSRKNKIFDIIAITETRIKENVSITNNLSIKNYSIEFTPTESSAGGTLLYIANHLSYKPRQDLNVYKKNELEPTFIGVSFLPYILQPTRITSHSKTLIDNIFTNITLPDSISGNLTATISDHLPQFLIVPNIFSNPPSNKSNIYERDWSNFDQDNFILDYFSINWNETMKIEEQNINYSTEIFLNKINELLDNFAPFKKISKCKLKFKSKLWITPGLQKSINQKKDPTIKAELHLKYKNHRNLISTFLKRSKQNYYKKYFESNLNN